MNLRSSLFPSRFGRRLLALFVGCALVPIGLLGFLSFRHMTRQLEYQSQTRLLQANKALGRAVFERLLLLEATLKSIPPRAVAELIPPPKPATVPVLRRKVRARPGNQIQGARTDGRIALGGVMMDHDPKRLTAPPAAPPAKDPEASQTIIAGLDLLARSRFDALEFLGDDGKQIAIFGQLWELPALATADSARVLAGGTSVVTQFTNGVARIYLARRLAHGSGPTGMLVGEVSADYLWGNRDQTMPSPTAEMAVVDEAGEMLVGSTHLRSAAARQVHQLSSRSAWGVFTLELGDRGYMATYWPIMLHDAFGAPDWTLVLSEAQATVLGPMTDFTDRFLLIITACTLAVLVLSIFQIRRSLVPLLQLQDGTRRIALQDFDWRVPVSSRDEFAELARSFNTMADRLGRQFKALGTAADIDRAVLGAMDAATIVDAVLSRISDVFPCTAAGITLLPSDRGASAVSWVRREGDGGRRESVRVELSSEDLGQLASRDVLHLRASDRLPGYIRPMAERGVTAAVVLPLVSHGELAGILALGTLADVVPTPEDL
ncbi:MAG TPA: HAMP domain-containing protein, partial [Gemmatimonadales bacterium]|nr:HAMP domain-containing protein [Gemmatimonadales bacterium]